HAVASQEQGDSQSPRTLHQKRQIEAVQIVIFDHVRIELADPRTQLLQELCFGVVAFARSLQRLLFAVRAAESNQKNPRMLRVQTGRFQIELQTMQRIERQLFEVRAP